MMTYLLLAYEFFKIGLFAVGGGMATVPFLIDLAGKYDWYTTKEFTTMVAISQSTPGPVGINMATYAGYNAAGISGAIVATFALVTPALFTIVLIAKFLTNFSENATVKSAFYGIRPTVAALIGYAVWQLMKISLAVVQGNGTVTPDYLSIGICIAAFALMQIKSLKKLHPLVWIVVGAIVGIIFKL